MGVVNKAETIRRLEDILHEYDLMLYYPHNLIDKMLDPEHMSDYHMEGTVLEHSILVAEEFKKINGSRVEKPMVIQKAEMLTVLLHDIGKIYMKQTNKGRVVYYGHERRTDVLREKLHQLATAEGSANNTFGVIDIMLLTMAVQNHMERDINIIEKNIISMRPFLEYAQFYVNLINADAKGRITQKPISIYQPPQDIFDMFLNSGWDTGKIYHPEIFLKHILQQDRVAIIPVGISGSGKDRYYSQNLQDKGFRLYSNDFNRCKKAGLSYEEFLDISKERFDQIHDTFTGIDYGNILMKDITMDQYPPRIYLGNMHLTSKLRKRFIHFLKDHSYKIGAINFLPTLEQAIHRNYIRHQSNSSRDGRMLSKEILERMNADLVVVTAKEVDFVTVSS